MGGSYRSLGDVLQPLRHGERSLDIVGGVELVLDRWQALTRPQESLALSEASAEETAGHV